MRRLKTPDWQYVGWHYKAIHLLGPPWHNRLWVRAKGMENVPKEDGFLFAANHSSWWDPILLQCSIGRPVNWLAKKEMMNNRFNKWFFFDKGGCIPVDRNSRNPEAFTAAVKALHDGRVIGIFPEGTRYVGKLGPAKTGVARLAMESGKPVVPTAILSDRFWPPGRAVPKLTQRIWLNVGEPFHLKGDPLNPEDAKRGTAEVMAAIEHLLQEARAARDAKVKWKAP
ncbi:MAG TPA: lysophospholipid acyltransferase family protein [Candidatus Thermoplasmatota archaeon]|nr:lysophospholipid acyltransferase family protein [Candidatus Thermoplasmatota archaeon]